MTSSHARGEDSTAGEGLGKAKRIVPKLVGGVSHQGLPRDYSSLAAVTDTVVLSLTFWAVGAGVSEIYLPVVWVIQAAVFRHFALYDYYSFPFSSILGELQKAFRAYLVAIPVLSTCFFLAQLFGDDTRAIPLALCFCAIAGSVTSTRALFQLLKRLSRRGRPVSIAVIGRSARAEILGDQLAAQASFAFHGYIEEFAAPAPVGERHLGNISDLIGLIEEHKIECIVLAPETEDPEQLFELYDYVSEAPVRGYVYHHKFDVIRRFYKSIEIAGLGLSPIGRPFVKKRSLTLTRVFDLIASIGILLVLLPLLALVATIIKLTSKGPIFFKSDRVSNQTGDTFSFLKFRSMMHGNRNYEAERADGLARGFSGEVVDPEYTKVVAHGLVTPIGQFLRKYSIDELPQLLSVLKGDMSLVGPRPTISYEFDCYAAWHKRRLAVKPGMTGLWQVVARSKTSFDEQAVLDIFYVRHKSAPLDLEILVRTIPVVLFGEGGG